MKHRTQILLDDWHYERLKATAERRGQSLSSLVHEAVAAYLVESPPTALNSIAGLGEDSDLRGRDHDRVLYGAEPSDIR